VGVKTIGYGHACQPDSACNNIKAPLTEPQAASMLAHELTVKYGPTIFGKVTRPLNNNQYSALTSFVYNLGTGMFFPFPLFAVSLSVTVFPATYRLSV
jgi:lysozyme